MRTARLWRRKLICLAAVAAFSATLGVVLYETNLLRTFELNTVDARFSIRGTQSTPSDLAVVQIDDQTFNHLGLQWPIPRHIHGQLIDRLREDGARVIAYDVQFTEPTVPREDNALIRAVTRARGHVVLGTTEVNSNGQTNIFGGGGILREIGARAGNTTVQPDPGGTLRRYWFSQGGLDSFAVASVDLATHHPVSPAPLDGSHTFWVNYRGPPGTIPTYSFWRVLDGKVPASAFRGKTVVVGASTPTLQDVHTTPTTSNSVMSGAEFNANAIWTVEHGFPLRPSRGAVDVLLILLLALIPPLLFLRLGTIPALGAAVATGAAYAVISQLVFDGGTILPVFYPLGALAISAIGSLAVSTLITAFERQWVRDTFSRFVPEAVVDDVLQRTGEDLRLGGVRREGTVLFSDLRGFTSFSESLQPDQVIDLLNVYLSEMSDAIMDHGGTLVAYMGDGIMAVFGAPIEQPDHADRALAAAGEMLGERLGRFNEWIRSQGLGEGFEMGVGLNSGEVMSGQVGSERRMEYTAVGDTTNTAARLEGMTKGTPHQLYIAHSTRSLLGEDPSDLRRVGDFEVRGRDATITVWTLASTDRAVPGPAPTDASTDAPSPQPAKL